jgi:hypothetical protein
MRWQDLLSPYVLIPAAGGFFIGPKYVKEHGKVLGALGGVAAGLLLQHFMAPKAVAPAPVPQQQLPPQPMEAQAGFDDYVDLDDNDEPASVNVPMPRGPGVRSNRVMPQAGKLEADSGWDNNGGWGAAADDAEIDDLLRQAKRGNGGY